MAGIAALAVAVGAAVAVASFSGRPDGRGGEPVPIGSAADIDPLDWMTGFAAALKPADPYRPPVATERASAVTAVEAVLAGPDSIGAAEAALGEIGFTMSVSDDPATGRRFALFASRQDGERSWGALLVDLSRRVDLAIEVPHPNSDLRTERLGVRVFRRVPGSILIVAGAHRGAAGGAADVAHNEDSLFHAMAMTLAGRRIPQIQLHGFADKNLDGADVVVSTGSAGLSATARRLADRVEDAGFTACRAWRARCGQLEGTTNVQGQAAAANRAAFIHLEVSWTVRRDDSRQADLVFALTSSLVENT